MFESGDILSVIEKARFLNTQWNRTFCAHCIHLSLITSGIYIVFHLTMTSFLYVFPSVSISVVCTFTYCGIKYQTLFIFTYLTLQSHLRELTNNSCRNRRKPSFFIDLTSGQAYNTFHNLAKCKSRI